MKNSIKKSFVILKKLEFNKGELLIILISSLVNVITEVLGIGIIFPIVETLTKNKFETNFFGIEISLESLKGEHFYHYIFGFVLIIIGIKFIIVVINSLFIARFWSSVNEKLTLLVFKNILNFNIENFEKNSNSTYQNLIVLEIEKFSELIKAQIVLVVESIILMFIVIMVFYYNFNAALSSFIFICIGYFLFYKISTPYISSWGEKRYIFQDNLQNDVKSGLMSYFSIKINGGFNFFIQKVEDTLSLRNKYIRRQKIFQNVPRVFIEFNTVLGLILTVYFLHTHLNFSKLEITNFFTILIISLSRILPSSSRILTSSNEISFYKEVTDTLNKYLNFKKKTIKTLTINNSISLNDVSFGFDEDIFLLKNLNFEYKINQTLGIYGKSGVGKSTLTKLLMGILSPTKGKILYDNLEIKYKNQLDILSVFGYVEQNVRIFKGTIKQNILLDYDFNKIDQKEYNRILNYCELRELEETLKETIIQEDGLNLSGGQIQRIGLARALYKKPKILVLDEFTSSLDNYSKSLILKSIIEIKKEWSIGIILVSHDDKIKSICDKIIIL